jgi:hypothetical protein
MKYTINELANSKGVSQPVREALLQMADYKQLYEQVCEQYDVLAKELEAINRQVEILSDALAESRREVAAPVREDWGPGPHEVHSLPAPVDWKIEYLKSVESGCSTLDELREARAELDALKKALAAQPAPVQSCYCPNCEAMGKELAALKAQPAVQEPVGVFVEDDDIGHVRLIPHQQLKLKDGDKLYTTPPAAQRQWVGLTDEEIFSVLDNLQRKYNGPPTEDSRVVFALAIEAKLKEKNNG